MGGGGRRARRGRWALLPTGLVAAAALLIGARLFTGVVILPDDPTTFLVLKRRPSMDSTIRAGTAPLRRDYVLLDDDENQLVYEPIYLAAMSAAPAAAGCLVLTGTALAWTRRGRRGRPR